MNRWRFLLLSLGSLCWAFPGMAQTAPSNWVSYDAASKTVTFVLDAGAPGASGPFNNLDGTPHSAEVIADKDPVPNQGGDPAIPAAYTIDLTQGLPQGGKDVIQFAAPSNGSFRIFCGVPGHGLSGMWIRFKVDPAAKSPSWVTS
jgi:hypothetical protein